MPKSIAKQSQPEGVEGKYEYSDIEAVVNKYYESKGNKTPLLVERSHLLDYLKENL